jgi:hypothetical protein
MTANSPYTSARYRFEQFLNERKYLYNVSPHTERLYKTASAKWCKHGREPLAFVAGLHIGT